MMAKPMKTLEFHYPMIQFLILFYYSIYKLTLFINYVQFLPGKAKAKHLLREAEMNKFHFKDCLFSQ